MNSSNMSGLQDNSMVSNGNNSRRVGEGSTQNASRVNNSNINNRSGIMFL